MAMMMFFLALMGADPHLMNTLNFMYCGCGALLFSFYIVYDTQKMLGSYGGHKVQFSVDDYCFAALNLYLDVINLFLVADLLTLSIAVPIFAGLGSLATQTGALAGSFAGFVTIMGYGWFEFGTFKAGLEMVTLMAFGNVKPPEVGLSASRTCVIFFVLPIITGSVTMAVSWCERVLESLGTIAKLGYKSETQEKFQPGQDSI